MDKIFKSIQLNHHYLNNNCLKFRYFHLCASKNGWMIKMPKIKISPEIEEDGAAEVSYYEAFKSRRKGVTANIGLYAPRKIEYTNYLSIEGFKYLYNFFKMRRLVADQRYIDKRVDVLGTDLAAAHFIVHRGGKIRFMGQSEWVKEDEEGGYELPKHFEKTNFIQDIDMSGMVVIYDGWQNVENLKFLKTLNVSRVEYFDDWCLDRISAEFANSLQELDVSHCSEVTSKGLETIVKMKNLRKLKINGFKNLANVKLVCLLLMEANATLKIEGITF